MAVLDKYGTEHKIERGEVVFLKIWNDEQLLLYWTKDREFDVPKEYLNTVTWMLIHQDYLEYIPLERFSFRKSYFRLIHQDSIPAVMLPPGYCITAVDIDKEAENVSRLITECYTDLHPSAETVKTWTNHPVFDKNLWIWVTDEHNTPKGLGIAERDVTISEGSLEWIQVLPSYQSMGIGKCIVAELLKRLHNVSFTTVSGECDKKTLTFYKSCGFAGEDMWWVLQK